MEITTSTTTAPAVRVRIPSREVVEGEIQVIVQKRFYRNGNPTMKAPIADVLVGTGAGVMKLPLFCTPAGDLSLGRNLNRQKALIAQDIETYVLEKAEQALVAMNSCAIAVQKLVFTLFGPTSAPTKGSVAIYTNYGSIFNAKIGIWPNGQVFVQNPTIWIKEEERDGRTFEAHAVDGGFEFSPELKNYLISEVTKYFVSIKLIASVGGANAPAVAQGEPVPAEAFAV